MCSGVWWLNVNFLRPHIHIALYEGGTFKVQVTLQNDFPYSSPSIGFQVRPSYMWPVPTHHPINWPFLNQPQDPDISPKYWWDLWIRLFECLEWMLVTYVWWEWDANFVWGGKYSFFFLTTWFFCLENLDLLNIFTMFLPHLVSSHRKRYSGCSGTLFVFACNSGPLHLTLIAAVPKCIRSIKRWGCVPSLTRFCGVQPQGIYIFLWITARGIPLFVA